jgi:hypothetical protein
MEFPQMTDTFDAIKALSELRAGLRPQENQAKLSFSERCGAFCALYEKTPHSIVARAFGITKTTASWLAGCLPDGIDHRVKTIGFEDRTVSDESADGAFYKANAPQIVSVPVDVIIDYDPNRNRNPNRKLRYQDVAREFIHLGRDGFFARYYTDSIHERLIRAKYQAGNEDSGRGQNGANRSAAKFSFKYYGPVRCGEKFYRIAWVPAGKMQFEGWHFTECQEDGSRFPEQPYNWLDYFNEDTKEQRAYRTSAEAFDAIFAHNGLESPRPKPGRPKAQI